MNRRAILRAALAVVLLCCVIVGDVAQYHGYTGSGRSIFSPLPYKVIDAIWPGVVARNQPHHASRAVCDVLLHAQPLLIFMIAYALLGFIPYFRIRTTGCDCRKCGPTLRGLSVPTCPECGEAI